MLQPRPYCLRCWVPYQGKIYPATPCGPYDSSRAAQRLPGTGAGPSSRQSKVTDRGEAFLEPLSSMLYQAQDQVLAGGDHALALQDDSDVTALCFTPDGQTLYSCSKSLILRSWNVEAGTCIRSWKV